MLAPPIVASVVVQATSVRSVRPIQFGTAMTALILRATMPISSKVVSMNSVVERVVRWMVTR